jgi:hypothetical protein
MGKKILNEKQWKARGPKIIERMEKIRTISGLSSVEFSRDVLGASTGYWSTMMHSQDFTPAHRYMRNLGWYFDFNTNDLDSQETFLEIPFVKKHREELEKQKASIQSKLDLF